MFFICSLSFEWSIFETSVIFHSLLYLYHVQPFRKDYVQADLGLNPGPAA